ncbi:MAG: hypothetical protein ACJA1S_002171, partial [Cellvibrionaceae bacterium]
CFAIHLVPQGTLSCFAIHLVPKNDVIDILYSDVS